MSEGVNQSPAMKHVTIFTDGAAVPNPGAGGYGVVLRFGAHYKELSGGFQRTTNNRMELMAVIIGLEALKEPCRVTLYSDSQYIVNAITSGSAFRWRENGWKVKAGGVKRPKNPDLWERLLAAYGRHDVEMVWVKGHAGLGDNERCDALAMAACGLSGVPSDPGYVEDAVEDASEPLTEEPRPEKAVPGTNRKITAEGQLCRHCGTPVVKRAPRQRKIKEGQTYYFAWYFYCPGCKATYLVEEAKQPIGGTEGNAGES